MADKNIKRQPKQDLPEYNTFDWSLHMIDPKKKDMAWFLNIIEYNTATLYPYYNIWRGNYSTNTNPEMLRMYMDGNQPASIYKYMFNTQKQSTTEIGTGIPDYVGIDRLKVLSVFPKYKKNIAGKLNKIKSKVDCWAIDYLANEQKEQDRKKLKLKKYFDEDLKMFRARMHQQNPVNTQNNVGVQDPASTITSMEFDFNNDEELALYMNMYYRQSVEVAMQEAVNGYLEYNEYDVIKTNLIEDAISLGICATREFMDKNTCMPKIEYERPENIFVGRGGDLRNFKDSTFKAIRYVMSLNDIITHFGDELTPDSIKMLYKHAISSYTWNASYQQQYSNFEDLGWSKIKKIDFEKIKLNILFCEVTSQNAQTFKFGNNRGGMVYEQKDWDYIPAEGYSKDQKWAQVIYKGYYPEGYNYIFDYGLMESMVREEGKPQIVKSSIQIWEFEKKSLVEQSIHDIDMICFTNMKLQHEVKAALPSGWSFNWQALNSVILGNSAITYNTLLDMYFQTGSTIHSTIDEAGNPTMANANAPHMRMENGLSKTALEYVQIIRMYRDNLESTIGFNQVTAGGAPEPRTSAAGDRIAAASAVDITYYLYQGMAKMFADISTTLGLMTQDIIKYGGAPKDNLIAMINRNNVAVIEALDDVPLHQYGMFVREEMSDEKRQFFEQMLMEAYGKSEIDISDVLFLVTNVDDYKQAIALFNLKRSKQMKLNQQMQQQGIMIQQKTEQQKAQLELQLAQLKNQGSSQAAGVAGQWQLNVEQLKQQGKLTTTQMQANSKLQIQEAKNQGDIDSHKAKAIAENIYQSVK